VGGQKSLKQQIADHIGRSGLRLPVFNPIALELQTLLRDENADLSRIESAIAKDPALVVQVLRLANSALYAGLNEITTVRQALMRLGARRVSRLATAAAQLSLYRSNDALLAGYMTDLWLHAYACALGASWLAEKSAHTHLTEAAFLAGLLHDIGKLLILKTIEDITVKEHGTPPPRHLVDDMLDCLHCEFGYTLMKGWNLPEAYCVIGRDHHEAHADDHMPLMLLVRLADQVCDKLGIGCEPQPDAVPSASYEAQVLRLTDIRMAELEIMLEDNALAPEPAAVSH